jgi:hypothetical protein
MEFEHAAMALLASMVLVLAGMVGWLYWQQTRMFQNMNNIVMVVGELAAARAVEEPEAVEDVQPTTDETVPEPTIDDRVSVDDGEDEAPAEPVVVSGPPNDVDGLEDKSKKELQDILTKRGIPYGKGDNKNALISLLKATS